MANVTVELASKIFRANRCVVRTSGNRVYVFTTDDVTVSIHALKGNQDGEPTSFSKVTHETGTTGLLQIGIAGAIDSNDIVHLVYYQVESAMSGTHEFRYITYDTSDDTFGTAEAVATLDNDGSAVYTGFAITLDANDDPHVLWRDALTDMGSTTYTNWYSNKTDTSWRTRVSVNGTTNNDNKAGDIIIGDPLSSVNADRPIIIVKTSPNTQMNAYYGDALDATAFTEETDITGSITVQGFTNFDCSLAIDSNEKIIIAFGENSSNDLMIVEHLNASAWSSWDTPVDVDTSTNYFSPSIAIIGTDIYIYAEDSTNSDLNLWKDEGSGFSEETGDPDLPNVGTFQDVKAKWSRYNNNSPSDLDYVFQSGDDILYNTFAVSTGTNFERAVAQTITLSIVNPRIQGHNRTVAQSVTHSESILREGSTFARIIAQSITHADSVVIAKGFVRAVAQSITHADSVVRVQGLLRTVAQSLTHTDSVLRQASTFVRAVAQALTHADSVVRVQGHVRTPSQTITHSDSAVTQKGFARTAVQAITHSESIARIQGHIRTAVQTITHLDAVARIQGHVRTAIQTITHSDATVTVSGKSRTAVQSITHSEVVARIQGHVRTASQTITHLDSILREGSTFARTAVQTITHSSIVVRTLGKVRTATQTITHSDSVVTAGGLARQVVQTITHIDSVARIQVLVRTATQNLIHTDSILREFSTFVRTAVQSITHSESIVTVSGKLRSATQTLTHIDSVARVQSHIRTFAQNLTHSDSVVTLQTLVRTATQSITHSSIVARLQVLNRTASQTLTHIDSVVRVQTKVRTVLQNITHSDSAIGSASLFRIASQIITHIDSVVAVASGTITKLQKRLTESLAILENTDRTDVVLESTGETLAKIENTDTTTIKTKKVV